jgi:hypothetical protein
MKIDHPECTRSNWTGWPFDLAVAEPLCLALWCQAALYRCGRTLVHSPPCPVSISQHSQNDHPAPLGREPTGWSSVFTLTAHLADRASKFALLGTCSLTAVGLGSEIRNRVQSRTSNDHPAVLAPEPTGWPSDFTLGADLANHPTAIAFLGTN